MAPTLTDREKELLVSIFKSLKAPLDVDLDKFAAMSGYKTRASANTAYHKLKAKIGKAEDGTSDADAVDDADADAEDTPVASSSTKKARGKKAVAVKIEEPETDEDDDESETIAVKAKPKPKPKSIRAAVSKKAGTAQPTSVRRSTRNSLKAKPVIKDTSSGESEDEEDEEVPTKRPITLKRGKLVYPSPEENVRIVSDILDAVDESAAVPEDAAVKTNTLKRAATESGSDFDELAVDTKRVKVDTDVVPAVEPTIPVVETVDTVTTSVVSVDPIVETYVVNDPDAVDVSAGIRMAVDDASDVDADADGASDVASNVASAATSGDHDDI